MNSASYDFLLLVVIVLLLFANYMAWFKGWGEKHYEKGRQVFPFSIIASFGKRFYVTYYKTSLIFVTAWIIAFYFATSLSVWSAIWGLFHTFVLLCIIGVLYVVYMTFSSKWMEKAYENNIHSLPFSLTARFGKTFFVWLFRAIIIFYFLLLVASYASLFLIRP